MPNIITIERVADGGTQVEKCEIFTFPTDDDRQGLGGPVGAPVHGAARQTCLKSSQTCLDVSELEGGTF